MQGNVIIGIDPAGVEKTTRWALSKNKPISTHLLYKNQEILKHSTKLQLTLIATDAPLSLRGKTDLIEDEEDYIVVPTERDWRRPRL